MPINTNNIIKSYVDTQKLRLPLTQFNDNQCPFDTISNTKPMIAVALRRLAFLLILFCISLINRRQIWTPTSQDQHFLGLRVLPYTGTTLFPSTLAISHKTIRDEEIIFCPHFVPIRPHPPTMNTNSYALAVLGAAPKTGRKSSEISESPARPEVMATEDWPAIAATTSVSQSERSQGNFKKGKPNQPTGTQRKLNAFFALAQADKRKFTSPPRARAEKGSNISIPADVEDPDATPYSPPSTKRLPAGSKATVESNLATPSSVTLSPLGKARGKASNDSEAATPKKTTPNTGKKSDPPTNHPATTSVDLTGNNANELEPIPTAVKLRPKSTKTTTPSSTKRKSTRVSVGFSPPEPRQVQLVEPEEVHATPKINHPHRTVLSATVRIDKVKDALSHFIGKMSDTLAFLRLHVDDTIAILPKSVEFDDEHIVDKLSFPTVVFRLNQRYFNVEARNAFSDASKSHNGRTVRLSLVMGSTVPITHQLLDEVRHDTSSLGVSFWYKPHQEVDTTTRLVFLGAPNNANKDEAKEIIDNMLRPLEEHLLATDPKTYPAEIFGLPWPDFAVVSEQPTGQPFVQPEVGKDGKPIQKLYVPPPSERRSLHIMCNKKDYDRLASLVTVAKAKNMWLKVFGMCYPVEAPDFSYSKAQCNQYLLMTDVHESAQMSYGTFRISGLKDPGVQSTLRRVVGDPITICVRQIMRMITMPREIVNGKVLPGQSVWLCVLRSDNGSYTGYYAGANSKHQKFASAFSKCPAAQILFFLTRHGIVEHDANKFIRNNFSMAQIRLIGQAKWDPRSGLAKIPIQPGEENILDAARLDNSLVDLEKLTKRDFEDDEAVVGEYNGPSATDPACYKFDSAQSVTTIKNNTERIKSTSAGKSVASADLGASVFSLQNDDEEDDSVDSAGELAAASDPLASLGNEEMQFDLSFLKAPRTTEDEVSSHGKTSEESVRENQSRTEEEARSMETDSGEKDNAPSRTAKVLEQQLNNATVDAGLAAAAVGLDLSSVAQEAADSAQLFPATSNCFAVALAGIETNRSFAEMFTILDSLIEETEETDEEALRSLQYMNIHVPPELRSLIVNEAQESGERVIDHLYKLHEWLRESEDEEADDTAYDTDRYQEREYDTEESILPRPVDYGNEKPQGCDHREPWLSTNGSAQTTLEPDEFTSRLGVGPK